ncbi:MAG: SGNH/GDSL hydrolase family protein [Planctomycetota bacterium]|nr:SGNH/GDSL hydrolase family protein [Planctomycetota bacterium]
MEVLRHGRLGPSIGLTLAWLAWLPWLLLGCQTPETGHESAAIGSHPPARVLFVGNSFTFWRGGLAQHLQALSDSMDPPLGYETAQVVQGGASLEVMWNQTDARDQIAHGQFDVVVLQEDLPETDVESFRKYSRKFVEAVRDAGARPILFMAWEYDRLRWISLDEIIAAHQQVADQLQVEVAPVGLAWRNSTNQQPELNMYARDAEHPSVAGMFLSLMVIESTISGIDPVERAPKTLPIRGLQGLHEDALNFLRSIAQQSIQQWNQQWNHRPR